MAAQAGAHGDYGFAFGKRVQGDAGGDGSGVVFGQRNGHQLGGMGGDDGDRAGGRGYGHQAGSGAQGAQSGHGGGSGFAGRTRNYQDVAEGPLVPRARARRQELAEHAGFDQRKENGGVFLEQLGRAADGRDGEFAHAITVGRQGVRQFGRGEGDGAVGARAFAHRLARIAGHARREVHGDDLGQRKTVVDFANALQHEAGGGAADAGAQQGIDNQGGIACLQGDSRQNGTAAGLEHAVIGIGRAH